MRTYTCTDSDGVQKVRADSPEKAAHKVARNYDPDGSETYWATIHISYRDEYLDAFTIAIDPNEPVCVRRTHSWRSPQSIFGGLEENPGVFLQGGGVIIHGVCAHCGRYRTMNTWARNPDTGEEGLTSIKYEPADEKSRAWAGLNEEAEC